AYAAKGIKLIIKSEKNLGQYPVELLGYEEITPGIIVLKVYDIGINLSFFVNLDDVKPILRPLSDLGTYLSTINTNVDFEIDSDAQIIIDLDDYQRAYVPLESYLHHVSFLLANHFDVFGLIDAG